MFNGIRFHKMGTKHKSYIERFENLYLGHSSFSYQIVDKQNIQIFTKENAHVDTFGSKSTLTQFILVLESFGFISPYASGYKIDVLSVSIEKATNSIFANTKNSQIHRYRFSRKIALLCHINYLNEQLLIENNMTSARGKIVELLDIKSETSWWEISVSQNLELLVNVLERIIHENRD